MNGRVEHQSPEQSPHLLRAELAACRSYIDRLRNQRAGLVSRLEALVDEFEQLDIGDPDQYADLIAAYDAACSMLAAVKEQR